MGTPHSTMVLWYDGTMVPWYHGTMVLWYHSTIVPWYRGTMVPWVPCGHRGSRVCAKHLPDIWKIQVWISRTLFMFVKGFRRLRMYYHNCVSDLLRTMLQVFMRASENTLYVASFTYHHTCVYEMLHIPCLHATRMLDKSSLAYHPTFNYPISDSAVSDPETPRWETQAPTPRGVA